MKKKSKLNIYVKKNTINQRIDNFLFKILKNIPKNIIYKKIRTGQFRINKKRCQPKQKLKKSDIIRIPPNLILKKKKYKNIINYDWSKIILYEDKYLLIINKPQGITVHEENNKKFGIIEIFRQIYSKINFLELVHRLDKDTSGILILAKKKTVLCLLQTQFKNHIIIKKYLTIVHGIWNSKNKLISNMLFKKKGNKKNKIIIHKKGKIAKTYFYIQQNLQYTTLLNVIPITGRTHQIRVHTKHLGNPIIFDNRYGNIKLDQKITKKKKKILLHAESIFFIHPIKKKKMLILAELNSNFKKYLNKL